MDQLENVECLKLPMPQAVYPFFKSDKARNFEVSYKLNESFGFYKDINEILATFPDFLESKERRLEILKELMKIQEVIVQAAIAESKEILREHDIMNPRTLPFEKMIQVVEGWLEKNTVFPEEFDLEVAWLFLANLREIHH